MKLISPSPLTFAPWIIAICLWYMRAVTGSQSGRFALVDIALDAALIATHTWANAPLSSRMGDRFGSGTNFTRIFLVPVALATYYLVRDTWACLSQW